MTLYLFCLATKGIFLLLVYGLRKLVQRGEIEMPSEKTLSAKKERVAQLVEMLKNSAAGVLVDYKGITVEEDTKLRKELLRKLVLTVSQTYSRVQQLSLSLTTTRQLLQEYSVSLLRTARTKSSSSRLVTLVRTFTTRQALRLSRRSLQEKLCLHSWLVPFRVLSRSLPQHFRLLWTRTTRLHNLYAA